MIDSQPAAHRFVVSEFRDLRSTEAFELHVTWTEFLAELRKPRAATAKDAVGLFSPARFQDGQRSKAKATELSMFVLDVDNPQTKQGAAPVTGRDIGRVLGYQQGLQFAMATSWSHTPAWPKFRVILPLARPIARPDWRLWAPAALEATGLAEFRDAIDPACLKNEACIYYWPASPTGSAQVVDSPGRMLDVPVPEPEAVKAFREKAKVHQFPTPGRAGQLGGGEYASLDVVAWFQAHGLYLKPKEGRPLCHLVTCPWEAEHTEPGGTGTAVFEAEGETWPSFECLHSHCTGRRIHDVLVLWGDADRFCAQPFRRYSADMATVWQREATASSPVQTGKLEPLATDGNAVPFIADPSQEEAGFPATVEALFTRYLYVSGLGKVLDRKWGTFMTPDDLGKTLKGRKLWSKSGHAEVDYFKESARRNVHIRDMVFRPGVKVQPPAVNLFTGFEIERATVAPRDGSGVEKLLGLMCYLCGSDVEWVLRWLAYPLKYPGAKLRSALVIHGSQGSGKSLVWDHIMRSVYGRWSTKVNQSDIESGWTGFMSQRLYVVAEEVTTRSNKPATSGLLKDWVTSETIRINEKNIPLRDEENRCNFVFLSNESVPILIDGDDRRYMVVSVPAVPLDRAYFQDVVAEWEETKGAAWYRYLMAFDVAPGFIHETPPVNRAKAELRQACRSSLDAFLDEWAGIDEDGAQDLEHAKAGGDLRMPYGPALYAELFAAYRHYCVLGGMRSVSRKTFTIQGLNPRGHKSLRHHLGRYVLPVGMGVRGEYQLKNEIEKFTRAAADFLGG